MMLRQNFSEERGAYKSKTILRNIQAAFISRL